jgi:serine/threonine-protein kinase
MDSAESTLVAGDRLDRYELLCPIASGGMASVWLARLRAKRGFEKLVAIKTIKTELVSDPTFQEMFLDEARIASRIIHPNVAQILDLGEQNDILYIVMEWLDGDSLAHIKRLALKGGVKMPLGVSLRIIADVCAGLHAAHQLKERDGELLGVIHRDVSPQNILITTEGVAKVIDFGLAKAKNRSAGPTQTGVVKGKIRYMAPEQVDTKPLDHRVDIWALGMCLYELALGRLPFDDEDDLQVVKRLMSNSPLPPFDVGLPAPIEKVLKRALVRDPNGRFESCSRMRRAIEDAMHSLDLRTSHDDVAEFVAQTLPDLAKKRGSKVTKAIKAADARELGPTSEDPLPLMRKRAEPATENESDGSGRKALESDGVGRTPSARSLKEQLGGESQKRSAYAPWLVVAAAAGVGAWILWSHPSDTPTAQPNPSAHVSASAPPPASAAMSPVETIELDSPDAAQVGSSALGDRPLVRSGRPIATSALSVAADAAPPAPTYNPAYSILTNPPEAGLAPPPPASHSGAPPVSAAPPRSTAPPAPGPAGPATATSSSSP